MPWRDKEKQREAIRKHYYANRQVYIDKAYRKRQALRNWVNNIKTSTPCTDCGVKYPYYVMDFDHLEDKNILVSKVINSGSWLQTKIEITKCEVVCSNCHRKRTHNKLQKVE